jgi:hypothetical protein
MIWLWLACTAGAPDSAQEPAWVDQGPDALPLPDFSDVDLAAAATDAMTLALALDLSGPWAAHAQSLAQRTDGCPDVYVGNPGVDDDRIGDDATGLSWMDTCRTPAGRTYGGFMYWETQLDRTAGVEGSRTLVGRASVSMGDSLELYVRGAGSDSFVLTDDGGVTHWQQNTSLDVSVEGSASGWPTEGGARTDLSRQITGGDLVNRIDMSGSAHVPDARIQDRFDSLEMDLSLQGELGAGPDDCTLEPRGYLGLRDPDAHWVHLVFLPLDDQDPTWSDTDRSVCDGCATLYVRGVEQPDPVCVDWAELFDVVPAPVPADYALSIRESP